jgi:hypothetical protein
VFCKQFARIALSVVVITGITYPLAGRDMASVSLLVSFVAAGKSSFTLLLATFDAEDLRDPCSVGRWALGKDTSSFSLSFSSTCERCEKVCFGERDIILIVFVFGYTKERCWGEEE